MSAAATKLPPVNYDPQTGLPTNAIAINMTGVQKRKASRKNRKASRKASRKCGWFKTRRDRKASSRKNARKSRKNRKASRKH
jgi:hypothetical protein